MTGGRDAWLIVEDRFDPLKAGHRETLCTLGNGYLGVRGAPEEGHPGSTPATFIAGVFDAAPGGIPELVVVPNWLCVRIAIDGEEFAMESGEMLHFRRVLDMREGVLERSVRWRGSCGKTVRLVWRRLASMADVRACAVSLMVEPEDSDVEVVADCAIDGRVSNARTAHLELVELGSRACEGYLAARTRSSGVTIAEAQVVAAFDGEGRATEWEPCSVEAPNQPERARVSLRLRCRRGERVTVEKYVGFATSLDLEGADHESAARHDAAGVLELATRTARRAASRRFSGLLDEHRKVWRDIWERCDIGIEGDDLAQRAARFAIFHMVQAAPRHTDRVSIGARGLSGEGYRGHVFWDTETFVVPFFTFTMPEVARNILGYRYNTLAAARRNAVSKGFRGAMYAWESADTGEETTPSWGDPDPRTGERRRILCGDLEHHITADVAYAVWQYCMATGDEEFLLRRGAEVLIETGRFWASRASYNPELGAYEILHVIGPDEYHEDVNNNFYTNSMARWNIRVALSVSDYLKARHPREWDRLAALTGVSQDEVAHMSDVAQRLVCGRALKAPRDEARAGAPVIEQFDGFCDLADVRVAIDGHAFRPMETVMGQGAVAGSKVIKQPDVLMALYLLEDDVCAGSCGVSPLGPRPWKEASATQVLRSNWDYYEPRTDHGSSLSFAIHSAIAARLGLDEAALRYLMRAARIDLGDAMGNAGHGVHMATQGGLWQAIVNGFAGVRARVAAVPCYGQAHGGPSGPPALAGDAGGPAPWASTSLVVDPRLPERWRRLTVSLSWRGTRLRVELSGHRGSEA